MILDYWTYELCPTSHVRQYRKEGQRVGVEFNLGKYESRGDKLTVGVRGGEAGPRTSDVVPHTFGQTYVNGTAGRKTHLRVKCASNNEHKLLSVEEPRTHEYIFWFSSPLACEFSCAYAQMPKDFDPEDSHRTMQEDADRNYDV